MNEWLHELLDWVGRHPEQAGLIVFAVALAESLAIVGVLVPGVVILIGAGALIGSGVLDFWEMAAWAVAGAVIGDGLSFWLGHHFDYLTARWRWFRLHPDHLRKGVEFFARYGMLSVVLGRFFGPLRAVVPLVAGLMRMPPWRFYLANVFSAMIWAPVYLAPGTLLARLGQLGELEDWRLWLALGVVTLAVTVWLLRWLRRRSG